MNQLSPCKTWRLLLLAGMCLQQTFGLALVVQFTYLINFV